MERENKFFRITLESSYGHKNVSEFDYDDVDLTEVIHQFYSLLVGHTFTEIGVLEAFKEYAEERLEFLKPLPNEDEEDLGDFPH